MNCPNCGEIVEEIDVGCACVLCGRQMCQLCAENNGEICGHCDDGTLDESTG